VIGGNDDAVSSGAAETSEGDDADDCVSDMLCTSLISCCCASPTETRRPPNPDIFYTMPNAACRGNSKAHLEPQLQLLVTTATGQQRRWDKGGTRHPGCRRIWWSALRRTRTQPCSHQLLGAANRFKKIKKGLEGSNISKREIHIVTFHIKFDLLNS
jgi:hypothetical protein